MAPTTNQDEAYNAAVEDVAFHDAWRRGRLRFSGEDHLDFLHRMSSNDVSSLAIRQGLRTVFCDARGRIVDLAVLARIDEDRTAAFVDVERSAALLSWLERYHFSERIEWEDRGAADGEIVLLGPELPALARAHLGLDLDEPTLLDVYAAGDLHGQAIPAGEGTALRLWGPADDIARLGKSLQSAGAAALDATTWEVLRIEAGEPAAGSELSLDHNPWETGLDDAIHLNKGCYIGQEVVARLDTYQKVKQRLVGLRADAALAPGQAITADDRDVGVVTSAAVSPRRGPLALAYVRRDHWDPGTRVTVGGVGAVVAALPFDGSR